PCLLSSGRSCCDPRRRRRTHLANFRPWLRQGLQATGGAGNGRKGRGVPVDRAYRYRFEAGSERFRGIRIEPLRSARESEAPSPPQGAPVIGGSATASFL